jgi:hypothetical protein
MVRKRKSKNARSTKKSTIAFLYTLFVFPDFFVFFDFLFPAIIIPS